MGAIRQTADGGFVAAGNTWSFSVGGNDAWIIRVAPNGDTLWTRTYGGLGNDEIRDAGRTLDGGFVLAGYMSNDQTQLNAYLARTNEGGETLWTRTYDTGCLYSVRQLPDSGFIFAGGRAGGQTFPDALLGRTDSDGALLWSRVYGGDGMDETWEIRPTSDGGYVAVGYTNSYGNSHRIWLMKTDSIGDTVWSRTYGGTSEDWGFGVAESPDSGFVVTGLTSSYGQYRDLVILKTDRDGNVDWMKRYGGPDAECGWEIERTSDNGYAIAGYFGWADTGGSRAWLVRTDSVGDTIWTRKVGPSGGEYGTIGYSLDLTSDSGYVLAGWTDAQGAGGADAYLVRMASYVGIEEAEREPPGDGHYDLEAPCIQNGRLAFSLRLPASFHVAVSLYSLAGREVASWGITAHQGVSRYVEELPCLSPGVYFLRLARRGSSLPACDAMKLLLFR